MKTQSSTYVWSLLLSIVWLLSSCGSPATGTPSGSFMPAHGDDTSTVRSTPTASINPPGASTSSHRGSNDSYAFVRVDQLWLVLHNASPIQVTHFDYSTAGPNPNIFWGQPLWFANDRFIVFPLKIIPAGIGGGGCGFTGDYGRSSAFIVLDTTSMRLSQITVSGEKSATGPGRPYDGYWEFLFQEDATHLLAWHNDQGMKGSGGLYRYDLNSEALTLVMPSRSVPGADNQKAWYPMRYSSGQLFYETMTPTADGSNAIFTIYRHSVSHPETPSVKVFTAGSEPFCVYNQVTGAVNTGPFTELGWDISPNGKQLVAQTIITSTNHIGGSVKVLTLQTGAVTTLFAQAPAQVLDYNLSLSWGPDSQTVLLKSVLPQSNQVTLSTATLTNSTTMQVYSTGSLLLVDNILGTLWYMDGTRFVLFGLRQFENTSIAQVYLFTIGKSEGVPLLLNARNFAWG